jgi:hypothetical protein
MTYLGGEGVERPSKPALPVRHTSGLKMDAATREPLSIKIDLVVLYFPLS